MSEPHAKRVLDAFSTQAEAFEDTRFNRLFTLDAEWLFERLDCRPDDLLLDVAAGTGHAARSLAPRVRAAVAVDLTPAMLAAGQWAAGESGVGNVVFQLGDAAALPFLEESFDVVVSRFALHHVEDPAAVIAEMARCLRPEGRIALADMVSEEDPALASAQNRLERLRDPSHTRMLKVTELTATLESIGLREISADAREIDRPLEPWLDHAQTDPTVAAALRAEIQAEIEGGGATGLRPYEADGEIRFVQRWASVLAVRKSA
jgi:ubiquinone/menaquinone biosynthesis C-methylase UbiE